MSAPGRLAAAGMALLFAASIVGFLTVKGPKHGPAPVPVAAAAVTPVAAPAAPAAPAPSASSPPPAAPPASIPMSWSNAGAMVWHTHDVDPTWLGQQLRRAGFGWVAIYLGSSGNAAAIDPTWVLRFIDASGLPVGGWSLLDGHAHADAGFAATQLKKWGLTFYIADAEAAYEGKPGISQKFVSRFRRFEPTMTAGLSSLCDANGIGLAPWASAGFAFLPQAYVNDFGAAVAPAACVRAATEFFPRADIHPTVGSYHGQKGWVSVERYTRLLKQAGTTGFSVYPAETAMTAQDWQAYGSAIRTMRIAAPAG